MEPWEYGLAGVIRPFFWLVLLGTILWLTRRLFPRAEKWLFGDWGQIFYLIGLGLGRVSRAVRRLFA